MMQTLKTLAVKTWYLLLGAVLAALVVENILLRQKIESANVMVQQAMYIAEKSNNTSAECISTLDDVRNRLRPAVEDVKSNPFTPMWGPTQQKTASVLFGSP